MASLVLSVSAVVSPRSTVICGRVSASADQADCVTTTDGGAFAELYSKFNHANNDNDRKEWSGTSSHHLNHEASSVGGPVQSSRASAYMSDSEYAFDTWVP